ncbi:MAG: hypothetical protein ACR652_12645 [Methylocystis sp.]|uniref:hypothetical protein n=1 Tax=Methylocystis sp. TaxID=1911079 RepID=UPI003DA29ACC
MRKSQHNRDPIKEFIMSLAPRLDAAGAAKAGLPARTRPGFSEKTRSRHTRRAEPVFGSP